MNLRVFRGVCRPIEKGGMTLQGPTLYYAKDEVDALLASMRGTVPRCTFGGNYGRCELEDGHDGRHKISAQQR
jgi:hypothetical protein